MPTAPPLSLTCPKPEVFEHLAEQNAIKCEALKSWVAPKNQALNRQKLTYHYRQNDGWVFWQKPLPRGWPLLSKRYKHRWWRGKL